MGRIGRIKIKEIDEADTLVFLNTIIQPFISFPSYPSCSNSRWKFHHRVHREHREKFEVL